MQTPVRNPACGGMTVYAPAKYQAPENGGEQLDEMRLLPVIRKFSECRRILENDQIHHPPSHEG
jgi:hypothetical protein